MPKSKEKAMIRRRNELELVSMVYKCVDGGETKTRIRNPQSTSWSSIADSINASAAGASMSECSWGLLFILVDGKTKGDHAVSALGEGSGPVEQDDAGGQGGGLGDQVPRVAHRLVGLVLDDLSLEFLDNCDVQLAFAGFLRRHAR